jgi:hypothetical protein
MGHVKVRALRVWDLVTTVTVKFLLDLNGIGSSGSSTSQENIPFCD